MSTPHINDQHCQDPLPIDVISIQSQVVYGCVGNSAAVPTLEQQGLTVAAVPTVLLSNTPLYPSMYGGIIPNDWFSGYLDALIERRALEHVQAILLGYLGGPAQAETLATWLSVVRRDYPHILIQIDPVLGDIDSGLYVDPALGSIYRDTLRHLATGMTPNHFELEYLTKAKIHTVEEAIDAAKSLLGATTEWIVATSVAPQTWAKGSMEFAVIDRDAVDVEHHPCYDTEAKGTGDVFSAVLAAQLLRGETLAEAARKAAQRVMMVVRRSNAAAVNELMLIEAPNKGR